MEDKSARNDFTRGSIVVKLLLFMLPILGSLILQLMYGAVDLIIVGHFGTTAGLSGVSTGSSVLNLVTYVINGLAVGVTVLIGRYIGKEEPGRIGPLLGGTIFLFSLISVVLSAALIVLAPYIASVMQCPVEAAGLTVQYIRICGAGIFFIIAYNIISSVFRGLGDGNTPLFFVAAACCVNVVLDLIFVAVFDMNVAGAALATVLAQAVSVCLSIIVVRRRSFPFALKWKDIRFGRDVCDIVRLGAPLALQQILVEFSFSALVAFVNALGLEASSGYGVANRIFGFIMLISSAIMQSMASFVSQNVGAGQEKRAKQAVFTGMSIGVVIGGVITWFVIFYGDLVSALFTADPAVIVKSWDYLKGISAEACFTAVLFSFIGYFNGHQQTLFVMLQGISQTFLVRLPVAYIMSIQPNASLTYIGMAAPLATCFGIVINLLYFVWYNKRLKNVET